MKDTEAALGWIVEILNRKNIPFQIGGGFAARIYGVDRLLNDIDIAVPTKNLQDIYEEAKEYITHELRPFKDEKWDVTGMTLEYKGQKIDIVGAQGKKILDDSKKEWVVLENDFSASETHQLYGITISVMPKDFLINYKKILLRDVDKKDLEGLGASY